MDYNQYYRLKKGNFKTFCELYPIELRRLWFVCYHITQDVSTAAPLLLSGWKKIVEQIIKSSDAPKESLIALASAEIFQLASQGIDSEEDYEALPIPSISKKYAALIDGIKQLDYEERCLYLLTAIGGLNAAAISKLTGISLEQAKKRIAAISLKAQGTSEMKKMGMRDSVYLSTQFKSPDGKPFEMIKISPGP